MRLRVVMGGMAKEIVGVVISFTGFLGVIIVCGIPMWRETSYIGANVVTAQITWDGLWMNCVMQSTGQMQCKIHQSLLRLSEDLQAARALVVISIVVGFIGVALASVGGRCTRCLEKDSSKATVVVLGGVICIFAGLICLVPVCWSAAVTIIDFKSPLIALTEKRELGSAIFIGWATSLLLIIGGSILCSACQPHEDGYDYRSHTAQYSYPESIVTSVSYVPVNTNFPQRPYTVPGQYMGSQAYTIGRPYSVGQTI